MTVYAIDIETNDPNFEDGHPVDGVTDVWFVVILNTETNEFIINEPEFLLTLNENDVLVGHNIVEFDLPVIKKIYDIEPRCKVEDTVILSRLQYPDREGGHKLEAWGERLGDAKLPFSDWNKPTEEMLTYCKQDTKLAAKLYEHLNSCRDEMSEQSIQLEHDFARVMCKQAHTGFQFDTEAAIKLADSMQQKINTILAELNSKYIGYYNAIGTVNAPFKINGEYTMRCIQRMDQVGLNEVHGPFTTVQLQSIDWNSDKEKKRLLLDNGWKPQSWTPTGLPQLDDSIMHVPFLGERIQEYGKVSHRLSQLQGLIEKVDSSGRIHGGGIPCGTNTGRVRHTIVVNIPRQSSPYGTEMRSLFIAGPGKKLVGYDARALELRILAHYINNPAYTEAVCTTDKERDAHTLAGKAAGLTGDDVRQTGKTINYALIYGARDRRLGSIVGGNTVRGAKIRSTLYNLIPGLKELIASVENKAKCGYLIGLDGRRLYVRNYKSPLNTLIQGGGAVFMKSVARHISWAAEELAVNALKVLDQHDEAQWEAEDNEYTLMTMKGLIQHAFKVAEYDLKLNCPQEPDIKIGNSWAETH